ncbi:MAG TPA: outer membrane beta-barrel protein [Ferruginibacter sp.]|nr:outer membrane beta-barrel protein [Ferruginibacter sp.]
MDENLHNIENLFRNALDDNEETASENVWEAIDKRLDKDKIVSIKRSYANLKRIAIMLLLLLTSYVLYDVYKVDGGKGSQGFVKNNEANDSGNQKEISNIPEIKSTDRFSGTNSSNTSSISTQQGKNAVIEKVDAENTNPVNTKEIQSNQKVILQKQAIAKKINSDKDNSENQAAIVINQKKKYSTRSSSKIKIISATAAEDGDILVKNNDEQQYKEIPTLRKLKISSIEPMQLLRHDSIDKKQLIKLIAAAKIKISDTANNSVAKNSKKTITKPSRFSVTPFFSPDIAWYRLQDNEINNQHDNASELEKEEKHEFSSTYGALVDYKINKHWGLQSGLTLSNTNITVDPKTIYAQQDNTGSVKYRINTSSGYGYVLPSFSSNPAVGDSLYAFTSTHSLQYIGIPLAVTYNVTRGKFKFNALAGLSANILTKAKLETTVEKGFINAPETVDNLQGLRKIYFSGLAGVGVDYKLSKKTAVTFAPTMRFALNSINKDATVKSYPMSFGFVLGLKLDL